MITSPLHPAWPELKSDLLRLAANRLVIWDFDGVIGDTEPFHERTYRELLQDHGHQIPPDWFAPFVGHQEQDSWRLFGEAGWPVGTPVQDLIATRRRLFTQLCLAELRPSWLVTELAEPLSKVAAAQWCVSAGDPATVRALLAAWELSSFIPPHPRPPSVTKKDLLDSLYSAGPALVFEDNPGYLASAYERGITCVEVRHGLSTRAHTPVLATVKI